jgi:hypothetical protein
MQYDEKHRGMTDKADNPYSAPQTVPRQESSILNRCFKRGGLGVLVAVIVFQAVVQFNWHLESGDERYRGMMHCGYCLLVAVTSVFTQTEKAKAEGRSGILSASLFFVVALIAGMLLTRLLGIIPYPHYRSIPFTLEMSVKEISIVWLLDIIFVAFFASLKLRTRRSTPTP